MTDPFVRGEDGQAIVIVGIAMFVLLGALALSVDWGYGLAARRAAQNQADAAALAAGKLLVTRFVSAGQPFGATPEDVWNAACAARNSNILLGREVQPPELSVSFYDAGGGAILDAGNNPVTITHSGTACSLSGSVPLDGGTVFVSVRSTATYSSLFSVATRQSLSVAASARAQLAGTPSVYQLTLPDPTTPNAGVGLSGATTTPNVPMWPIAPHFDLDKFTSSTPCGVACDPTAPGIQPMTLWPAASRDRYGTFRGLITPSHVSTRIGNTHQLLTEADYTATVAGAGDHRHDPTPRLETNQSDRSICPDPTWDTNGSTDATKAVPCDVPNWFYYGFRGSISLGTNWVNDGSWNVYKTYGPVESPDPLGARQSCDDVTSRPDFHLSTPSCVNANVGDWVETVSGDVTQNMALRMEEFIARYGHLVPYSGSVVGGAVLGKAVVVNVFFWDCAEHYQASDPPGARWHRIDQRSTDDGDPSDCSQITRSDVRRTTVDRVHVFTVVPFTFYEGLITTGGTPTVRAYWGDAFGVFGTAGCAVMPVPSSCELNPLNNSAFLVPDE